MGNPLTNNIKVIPLAQPKKKGPQTELELVTWVKIDGSFCILLSSQRLKNKDKYAIGKDTINSIFHERKGHYGDRRVTAEMRKRGFIINHKIVRRLMMSMYLKSQIRKISYRSYKEEIDKITPNIINRDFVNSALNQKWATDVTQINIGDTKLYLSPILDMFNGAINII